MVPDPSKKQQNFVDSLLCAYIVSVIAAWNAELVTYPLDLVKTRLQIQGEIANKQDAKIVGAPYRGFLKTYIGIITEEGFFKLWQGISAVLYRHVIYSGTRMVIYRKLKEDIFENDKQDYFPVWKSAFCGIASGVVAQFIASPADLLKTQLQMEGKRKLMGLPPRVDGLIDAFKQTVAKAGYRGLWRGAVPNCQRAALVTMGDISAYDISKRFILGHTSLKDDHFVHILASIVAGLSAAGMGTPADVMKTRMMNQQLDENGKGVLYKSSFDCVQKTVRNEGLGAMYKGFVPMWMRLAPWSLTFWLTYERVLSMLGAEQF